MRSAVLLTVFLSLCAATAFAAVVPKTQLPQMKPLLFEGWGFQLEVPKQSQRKVIPSHDDVEMTELHVYGEYVYLVRVTKNTPDTLTSTAIEQDIQAESNYASRLGQVKRWEITSRKGDLFKGTSHAIRPEEDMPDEAAELNAVLKGRMGYICSSSMPISDESSPILTVGVIGIKGRNDEIENMAKFFAFGVVKLNQKSPLPTQLKPPPSAISPSAPAKPRPELKKGQIEVSGVVESISADKKKLVAIVDQIRLPGGKPIKLDPPRKKTVIFQRLPAGAVVGTKLVAIGKDDGVGTALKANYVEIIPVAPVKK